jgi:histidine triad (HIT) family protein
MDEKSCIFCKIARGEVKKNPFYESDSFVAFEDINPIVKGHLLLIPKKHLVTLLDIPNNLGQELLGFMKKLSGELLDRKLGDGFNILMRNLEVAGQEVMHAHIHIVPRKEEDGVGSLPV